VANIVSRYTTYATLILWKDLYIHILAFGVYIPKQAIISGRGIQIFRAQFLALHLGKVMLNAANIYLFGIVHNANIYTGLLSTCFFITITNVRMATQFISNQKNIVCIWHKRDSYEIMKGISNVYERAPNLKHIQNNGTSVQMK